MSPSEDTGTPVGDSSEPSGLTALQQPWFTVLTLNQRWSDVVSTLCACWGRFRTDYPDAQDDLYLPLMSFCSNHSASRKHKIIQYEIECSKHPLLTLLLLNTTCLVLLNSVDPDQLASEEAKWSGSALFVIKYVNFYQKRGSSNLIGWKLEVGVAS